MTKNDILIKAKRLFINSENYSDDFLYIHYKIAKSILPITDESSKEVMLDHLDEVMYELLNKREIAALNAYFSKSSNISLTVDFYKYIYSSLSLIKRKQEYFYTPQKIN